MVLPVNTLLQGGKYKIVRFINRGGLGCTYEAEHASFKNKRVAIKEFFIRDFCVRNEETFEITVPTKSRIELVERLKRKFIDEANVLFDMRHPGIVRVTDTFEENNTAYYVMEYINGHSLHEIVKSQGALPEEKAIEYIRQVSDALRYLHSLNRLHLDIKPGNIMIDSKGKAILIDFGTSKHYDEKTGENTTTLLGINTKGYAPPEQTARTFTTFSPSTDIYALGATLYNLLTGITPLDPIVLVSEDKEMPPLPSSVSESTKRAVKCAMEPQRSNRTQTVDDFLAMLNTPVVEPQPIQVPIVKKPVVEEPAPSKDMAEEPAVEDEADVVEVEILAVELPESTPVPATEPIAVPDSTPAPIPETDSPQTTIPESPKPLEPKNKSKSKKNPNYKWIVACIPLFIIFAILGYILAPKGAGEKEEDVQQTLVEPPVVEPVEEEQKEQEDLDQKNESLLEQSDTPMESHTPAKNPPLKQSPKVEITEVTTSSQTKTENIINTVTRHTEIVRNEQETEEACREAAAARERAEAEARIERSLAPTGYHYDYAYVDLGLPSGLLWATYNVGATSLEENGNYYAWGEVETKSSYTEKNSKTFNRSMKALKKDVAQEQWNGNWRLPTAEEFDELINTCEFKQTTQKGKKGYLVTGPNGKSIFLPAAGAWIDNYHHSSDNYVLAYWSSTPRKEDKRSSYALCSGFTTTTINREYCGRNFGCSIRPVVTL